MLGIIGKKIGMTQIYNDGILVPVTLIQAGPCKITQVKTKEKDGYNALQLGFGVKNKKNITQPLRGHLKKSNTESTRVLKEFRLDDVSKYNVGDELTIDIFEQDDIVNVFGISKGKGFQGSIKRHNHALGPKTHGSKHKRLQGSLGASATPARVPKGRKLPGRMGGKRAKVKGLQVVMKDLDNGLIAISGAVPGWTNATVYIEKYGR